MPLSERLCEPATLLAVSVPVLSLLWWLSTRRPQGLPPGPGPALPLLGHLYLLDKDPRPKLHEWRRQYGDVFSLYFGGRLVVVLSGYETLKETFVKMGDVFQDRPDCFQFQKLMEYRGISGASGSVWKEQRKVTMEILRELGLGSNVLADKIQEEVSHFIKALHSYGGQATDVKDLVYTSVSNNITSVFFGQRHDYDDPDFTRQIRNHEALFKNVGSTQAVNFFPWLEYIPGDPCRTKTTLACIEYAAETIFRPQLKKHLESYTEGEITDFVYGYIREMKKRRDSGEPTSLDEKSLIKLVQDMFFAGSETTTATILWAVLFLMHHPDVQDKCYKHILSHVGTVTERAPSMRDRQELTYLEATIMETQRLGNVAPLGLFHNVGRDITFKGFKLPKDTMVLPFLETCLLDPDAWGDPQSFRPERFIDPDGKIILRHEFVPFGIGRRVCAGEQMARMELFLYLTTMIQHFRFLPPEDGQLPSLEGVTDLTHKPQSFKVRLVAREK